MNVSVIIPNYNHARYLQQRIDSVLNQRYTDFEVIILDDCSTDNSLEIINQYKNHPKITSIICNKQNSGSTFKQWEKGVALGKGDFIWIAESDDYADEIFLSEAMHTLTNNTEAGLFFCNYYSIDEQGQIFETEGIYSPEFRRHFNSHQTMNGKQFCEQYLFFSNLILNASAVIFKKELFATADKSYTNLKITGDWRMWVNICYNTNIFFDQKRMNYFRTHLYNVRSAKASIMGVETIKNLMYFEKKTVKKSVKKKLKESICKTWVYSFNLNKNFDLNINLLKEILKADLFFPLRLFKRVFAKVF